MHLNSQLLFEQLATQYFRKGSRVLEIGPDGFPSTYRQIVNDASIQWDTLDIYEHKDLTYSSSEKYSFQIEDNSYDIVLSGQVLEHVPRIWAWMPELSRVCKPGGFVITVSPVSWPYHEAPLDCWRAYPAGMQALYDDSSLDVVFATWDSLEVSNKKRRLPGRSAAYQPKRLQWAYRILGLVGFPVECAFDTLTIGRKRRL